LIIKLSLVYLAENRFKITVEIRLNFLDISRGWPFFKVEINALLKIALIEFIREDLEILGRLRGHF
jgi:hypothetical protein